MEDYLHMVAKIPCPIISNTNFLRLEAVLFLRNVFVYALRHIRLNPSKYVVELDYIFILKKCAGFVRSESLLRFICTMRQLYVNKTVHAFWKLKILQQFLHTIALRLELCFYLKAIIVYVGEPYMKLIRIFLCLNFGFHS